MFRYIRQLLLGRLTLSQKLAAKRFIAVSRRRFLQKGDEYKYKASPPSDRRREIMIVDGRVPTPDQDAGSARMMHILRSLRVLNRVVFVSLGQDRLPEYEDELRALGVELVRGVDIYRALLDGDFALAIVSRPDIAKAVVPTIRRRFPSVEVIFDPVDLHSVRYAREFELTGEKSLAARASTYARIEKQTAETVDLTWCASSEDMRMLAEFAPAAQSIVIPTMHSIGPEGKPFDDRRDLFFLGNMRHTPNLDSLRYLIEDILPRVWGELPDVRLFVAGGPLDAAVVAFDSERVRIMGYVPDLEPYFAGCRLMVAPLRFGAGINGKIGESMANGLPVVTTSLAARSFGIVNEQHALVADDADSFAAAILRGYADGELWKTLARNGRELIAENFAPNVIEAAITQSIDGLLKN